MALDEVERTLRDLCTDAVEPPLAPTIERLMLPNAAAERVPVIKVSVPRSLFVHRSPGGYLHRVGSAKRVMSTDYLARLFQQRSQTRLIRFDEQPVADAAVDDLRPDLWQRFRTTRSDIDDHNFLTKLGLVRQDDRGVARPTVAGRAPGIGRSSAVATAGVRAGRRLRAGIESRRAARAARTSSMPRTSRGRWTCRPSRPAASLRRT